MYIIYLITFVISFLFTLGVLPWVIKLCYNNRIFDISNSRKIHSNNIPRLGGVVFFPSLLISAGLGGLLMRYVNDDIDSIIVSSTVLLIGAFLIYLVGVADDLIELGAKKKFLIQAISALAIPFCGLSINNLYGLFGLYELPMWASYPITIFVVLLIVNAMNLIDGIDGLSSIMTLIALSLFAALYQIHGVFGYVDICLAMMGTILVFIYFNVFGEEVKKTKTFMGDAGSLIIGYALAFFAIKYAMDTPKLSDRPSAIIIALTPIIIPVFDLIRVAFKRFLQRKGIFTPDKQHIHHICMANGLSMHKTLVVLVCAQIFLCVLNLLMCELAVNVNIILIADIILYIVLLIIPHSTESEC